MGASVEGKVVFVTGAARGIGAETAKRLAKRGARLALFGFEPEKLAAIVDALGPGHLWIEGDVTDQGSLDRAVQQTVEQLGGIDIVIANAGIAANGTVAVTPPDALARTIEVNLIGVIRTVSATLPHVTTRRGYILIISSASAFRALPGMSAYSASKVGAEYFGEALRLENAHKGVAVGVAHPSWIDTDLVRDAKQDSASFEQSLKKMPYPFNIITPLDVCAEALVEGIERRERTIYVPKALAPFAKLRTFFTGAVWDKLLGKELAASVTRMEAEAQKLGRSFGKHSVETTGAAAKSNV